LSKRFDTKMAGSNQRLRNELRRTSYNVSSRYIGIANPVKPPQASLLVIAVARDHFRSDMHRDGTGSLVGLVRVRKVYHNRVLAPRSVIEWRN